MRQYDLSLAQWRRSTYSDDNGGECVEVAYDFIGAARWRTSSHSDGNGGSCVEVAYDFIGAARWRASSHSGGDGGEDCVEVADGVPGIVPVRDSKVLAGPVLLVGPRAWTEFIDAVAA
ncbi:DUF397 domain-containing protein [Streptomyces dioscori]|uniref:DUF397 domain-containing protein n=1 Tax=Streptomyces dioscori TaxID=2109333 RepID=A0A2P8QAQ2_9ACTN|nr:DUF397 domain-containing protein [Streptomyces dioscori]PSM43349.1 DUF397 domain-containing protein [Streptomyces dioscori]